MNTQVYADKWEWLSKQPHWERLLKESGITKIKKKSSVEQVILEVRQAHPHTFLPWNHEGYEIRKLEQLVEAKRRVVKATTDLCDTLVEVDKKLQKENEELKKENEELKREIKELRFPDGYDGFRYN
jgi:predicted RNase H-like nuclease (RuvC/YqgF family)